MKQLFTLTIIILTFILFSGCQNAMSVFKDTDSKYEIGLQHTKVKPIVYKNETKAIINATYLNSVDKSKWNNNDENFLIGIYISEDNEIENTKFIKNSRYKLSLNKKKYSNMKRISNDDKLYKHIPLKNPWARYYIISFKKDKEKKILNLEYINPIFGKVEMPFEKE
ncbi:MAG: hypothetical protein DRG78_24265 [Epsilonproteobacteria bacterium]|nr:MAG: hypothetical protein DRG78_24265 [Campylobacterota bacterium]